MATWPPGGYEESSPAFSVTTEIKNGDFCLSKHAKHLVQKCEYFSKNWGNSFSIVGSTESATGQYRGGLFPMTVTETETLSGTGTRVLTSTAARLDFTISGTLAMHANQKWFFFTDGVFKNIGFHCSSTPDNTSLITNDISPLLPFMDRRSLSAGKLPTDANYWLMPTSGDGIAVISSADERPSHVFKVKTSPRTTRLRIIAIVSRALWMENGTEALPGLKIVSGTDSNGCEFDTETLTQNHGFMRVASGKVPLGAHAASGYSLTYLEDVSDSVQVTDPSVFDNTRWIDRIAPANSAASNYLDSQIQGAVMFFSNAPSGSYGGASQNMYGTNALITTTNYNTGTFEINHEALRFNNAAISTGPTPDDGVGAYATFDVLTNIHHNPLDRAVVIDSGSEKNQTDTAHRAISVTPNTVETITVHLPFYLNLHTLTFQEIFD